MGTTKRCFLEHQHCYAARDVRKDLDHSERYVSAG